MSQKEEKAKRQKHGDIFTDPPWEKSNAAAFLRHAMRWVVPGGKVVLLLPQSAIELRRAEEDRL
jgi:type I restriction-modification system DNA methylase subunit